MQITMKNSIQQILCTSHTVKLTKHAFIKTINTTHIAPKAFKLFSYQYTERSHSHDLPSFGIVTLM